MTREEILAMKPGIELDAAIAEMLGYKAYKEKRGEHELAVMQHPGDREPWLKKRNPDPERYTEISCLEAAKLGFFGTGFPEFSKNIAAVWNVIEFVATNATPKPLMFLRYDSEDNVYNASFGYSDKKETWAEADNAPEAICKAALWWVN